MSIFHKISCINMKTVSGFRFRNERPLRVDIFQSQCFCAYVSFQSQYSSLVYDRYLILKILRCVHLNMYMLFYIVLMTDFLIRMYPPKQFHGSYMHVPLSANLVYCDDVHVFGRIIDHSIYHNIWSLQHIASNFYIKDIYFRWHLYNKTLWILLVILFTFLLCYNFAISIYNLV